MCGPWHVLWRPLIYCFISTTHQVLIRTKMTVMFFFSRRSTSHRFAPRDSGGPRLAGKPERIRTEDHIWLAIRLLWGERGTLPACGCQGLLSILRKLPSLRSKYVVSEIKGHHLLASLQNCQVPATAAAASWRMKIMLIGYWICSCILCHYQWYGWWLATLSDGACLHYTWVPVTGEVRKKSTG